MNEEKQDCWVVLLRDESKLCGVHVYLSAEEAGMEAAAWLGNTDGDTDGYVPDLVNAAMDGDSEEFVSNDDVWSAQIFKRSLR